MNALPNQVRPNSPSDEVAARLDREDALVARRRSDDGLRVVAAPVAWRGGEAEEKVKFRKREGPEVRRLDPAQAISRWFARGRTSLEEVFLQLYWGRLALAEVEAAAEILWPHGGGAVLVRDSVHRILEHIDRWLQRPLGRPYPYVFLDAIVLKARKPAEPSTGVFVAVGVNEEGYRELLGIAVAAEPTPHGWDGLLAQLEQRGLTRPELLICAVDEILRTAVQRRWPGCPLLAPPAVLTQHLIEAVPLVDVQEALGRLEPLADCADGRRGAALGRELEEWLAGKGYARAAEQLAVRLPEHLAYLHFPATHWRRLRATEWVKSELAGLREQFRVLGLGAEPRVVAALAAAGFRRQCRSIWNTGPYFCFSLATRRRRVRAKPVRRHSLRSPPRPAGDVFTHFP